MDSELTRRDFLKQIGAASLLLSTAGASAAFADERKRPNIIFILADDLGYGDVGCYGQKVIQTPNIDRMAREGVRFTDCYSGSTVCAPSRCCLMTGYHTGHAYIRGNSAHGLRPQDFTVAELLKSQGYTTGIVGKWGLGEAGSDGVPNRKGFDYWFGFLNQGLAHNYYPDKLWRNEEEVAIPAGSYAHDLFTQEALDFVRREHTKPFFLYLAYTIPHANSEMKQGMQCPSDYPYGDKPWPENERKAAAMITRMDRDIGRLFALLKDLGIDDNTIVFFTSDNGPHKEGGHSPKLFESSGPLRGIKRDLYEGGIRVPMIARWPGKIEPNRTSDQVWAFWDFLPTAADISGAKPPSGIDGISMLPAILDHRQKRQHEYLYWEFHERGFSKAVRMGNWKAVQKNPTEPIELYDLRSDLGEKHDISADHPDVVRKIAAIIQSARTESEFWPKKGK